MLTGGGDVFAFLDQFSAVRAVKIARITLFRAGRVLGVLQLRFSVMRLFINRDRFGFGRSADGAGIQHLAFRHAGGHRL